MEAVVVAVGAGPLSLAVADAGVVVAVRAGVPVLFAEVDVVVAVVGVLPVTVVVLLGVAVAVLAGLAVEEDVAAGRAVPEETEELVLLAALLFTVELLAGLVVGADEAGLVDVAGLVVVVVAGRVAGVVGRALEAGRAVAVEV